MTVWVYLQLIWIALGIVFNLVSYGRARIGRGPLMPTPPLTGVLVLLIFVPFILLGLTECLALYLVLNLTMALFISYVGVINHVTAYRVPSKFENYASGVSLFTGAGINLFGVIVTLAGCVAALGYVMAG